MKRLFLLHERGKYMKSSYIAKQIDEEYKAKQQYKKRQACMMTECEACKYKDVCLESEKDES